ncbi:hypothetical protein D9M68_915240 [compost metagenome]
MLALSLCRGDHCCRIQVEKVIDEFVGVLGLDAIRLQRGAGEVFLVEGDNDAGVATNGSRQDMSVIRVGQRQSLYQSFVPPTRRRRESPDPLARRCDSIAWR